jgi:tetratricopeptide (TPR) repeat protein
LSPYLSGSFYENQYVWVQIAVILAGLIYWFFYKADAADINAPLAAAGIIAAAFFLSALNAVHPRQAWIEFGKYICCLVWVWLCQRLNRQIPEFKRWFQKGLSCFGLGTALLSLDAYFGGGAAAALNRCFAFLGFYNDGKGVFFNLIESGRLYGTFQYPNTAAVFWMAVYFLSVAWLAEASGKREQILAASSCIWIQAAFFLTVSRGAFLIWIPALILFFFLMPVSKRAGAGAALAGTSGFGFLAGAALSYLTGGGNIPNLHPAGWIVFAAYVLLAGLGIVYAIPSFLRFLPKALPGPRGFLPILIVLTVVAGAAAALAFHWTQPLDFGADGSWTSLSRSIRLTPGEAYRLNLTWEDSGSGGGGDLGSADDPSSGGDSGSADDPGSGPPVGHLTVQSQSQLELIGLTETELLDTDIRPGPANSAYDFTAPQDSQVQRIIISNTSGADARRLRLTAVEITGAASGRLVQAVPLRYTLLPETLAQRFLEAFLPSTPGLLRASYYRDGARMFADRPVLGGGGGAWTYLYGQYQSYEYYSTTAHNFLLQLAVESGIPGVLGWLGLAALLVWRIFCREAGDGGLLTPACIAAAAGLFVHSCMDFDFSYISVLLLFWGLLGMLSWESFPLFKPARPPKYPRLFRVSALIVLLAGGWIPAGVALGNHYGVQYTQAGLEEQYALAERYIEAAQFYDRFSPKAKLSLAYLLISYPDQSRRQEAGALADRALQLGWYDQDFLYEALKYYGAVGDSDAALKVLRQIPLLRPLASDGWQTKVSVLGEIAESHAESGRPEEARELINEALAVPREAERVCEGRLGKVQLTPETLRMLETYEEMHEEMYEEGEIIP